jgi:Xaa-Pro aminopeptidase
MKTLNRPLFLHGACASAALFLFVSTVACGPSTVADTDDPDFVRRADGTIELFDGRIVPAMPELLRVREQYDLRVKWLEAKHAALLPMMRQHGIDMWIVVNEEFHDDPVTQYIAPKQNFTGRNDLHIFVDAGEEGLGRFTNLRRPNLEHVRFFEPMPIPRNSRGFQDAAAGIKAIYEKYEPDTIGLNIGSGRGHDSGLTYDSYQFLVETLGKEAEKRFVSAAPLIEDYFDTRLPDELEYYRAAVLVTDILAQRALSNEVITPGVTRVRDVFWFFYEEIARLGVGAEPWFDIHTNVQHLDPETGKAIPWVDPAPDDYVYQRGDVIHLDCGFNYLGFATDWQKVAYILPEGETDVPEGFKVALRNANVTQEAMRAAPRPGMTGYEAAKAVLEYLGEVDFTPSLYSHSLGYHGHALGPSINARNGVLGDPPKHGSALRLGSYRAIELSATTAIPEWNGEELRIPMEDDAYLTENGFEWFRPIQKVWYLIR